MGVVKELLLYLVMFYTQNKRWTKIFNAKGFLQIMGSRGEIFAISIQDPLLALDYLKKAIAWGKKNSSHRMAGKFWTFYRLLCKFPVTQHKFDNHYYLNIKDKQTRDFDSQKEYVEWLRKN